MNKKTSKLHIHFATFFHPETVQLLPLTGGGKAQCLEETEKSEIIILVIYVPVEFHFLFYFP